METKSKLGILGARNIALYPPSEDIYFKGKKEINLRPDDVSKNNAPNQEISNPNEKDFDERHEDYFVSQISEELSRYKSHITRIEAHLRDENGKKEGKKDIHCTLEARLEGRQPIAVSNQDDTMELAISGALEKLKASLNTIIGHMQNH